MNQNVQRLLDYKEKLVLFPRRVGKAKKGEVKDTTAGELENIAVE